MKLRLDHFRRFGGTQAIDLNENLIALVGPNEAGKSSILHALTLVGRGGAKPTRADRTHGEDGPATVRALFTLEESDRMRLVGIPGGAQINQIWIESREDESTTYWTLDHRTTRDLTSRHQAVELVQALASDQGLVSRIPPTPVPNQSAIWEPELIGEVATILESNEESLNANSIQRIEVLGNRLRNLPPSDNAGQSEGEDRAGHPTDDPTAKRKDTAERLLEVARIERQRTPTEQVIIALEQPDVAVFDEQDRNLDSTYQLDQVATAPPAALANLIGLAGLNLQEIRTALADSRSPFVESAFERANARLKDNFRSAWTQAAVYPRLGAPLDGTLRVFVATEGAEGYSFPEERSDGLRWFIALHAFLATRSASHPVVLIDEAETHLHYDAQADLVDVLMAQKDASKVVYSTHSVGCLPPDLGSAIRVVVPQPGEERSLIMNSYWSVETARDEHIGYTPLLFAMGARLLSLTVPRFGVIAEGPSDAILLPSLLREATGLDRLPYRVVPGLSQLGDDQIATLPHNAGSVVCLTDGDGGGQDIRNKLVEGGFPPQAIFDLGSVLPGCALEDLVTPETFVAAVNDVIETWSLGPLRIEPSEVPPINRWGWLQARGEGASTSVSSLSKTRVAQRIVDLARLDASPSLRSRLSPSIAQALRELHGRLQAALNIRTPR